MYSSKEILVFFNEKFNGNWERIFTAISKHEAIDNDEFYKLTNNLDFSKFVAIPDEDYPSILKRIARPPFVIYKNDVPIIENMAIRLNAFLEGDSDAFK